MIKHPCLDFTKLANFDQKDLRWNNFFPVWSGHRWRSDNSMHLDQVPVAICGCRRLVRPDSFIQLSRFFHTEWLNWICIIYFVKIVEFYTNFKTKTFKNPLSFRLSYIFWQIISKVKLSKEKLKEKKYPLV